MVILQVNTLEHSGTWLVPMLIGGLASVLFTVLLLFFNSFKSAMVATMKEMKVTLKDIYEMVSELKTGKEVHEERFIEVDKRINKLEVLVDDHGKKIAQIEKEHYANHILKHNGNE